MNILLPLAAGATYLAIWWRVAPMSLCCVLVTGAVILIVHQTAKWVRRW